MVAVGTDPSDQTKQAARAQARRRQQIELERLQARLDVLYDDRLDGRIDAGTYDKKASEIREQQEQIRQKIRTAEASMLPVASEAVDLMSLTSKASELFQEQVGAEQRKLLHLVLKEASWKGGELRMSLREPFEELRLSNSASDRNSDHFDERANFDNWRATVDAFRTFLAQSPTAAEFSNPPKRLLIQESKTRSGSANSIQPGGWDTSRTPPTPDHQKEIESRSNGK